MKKNKIIYLAGAMRGDPSYKEYFNKIIDIVESYAVTRTELSDKNLITIPDFTQNKYKQTIYERDIKWIDQSQAIIAECSGASLGVGIEIGYAIYKKFIPVLCLYHENSNPSLMILHNNEKYIFLQKYRNEYDLNIYIKIFLKILERYSSIYDRKFRYNYIVNIISKTIINMENIDSLIDKYLSDYDKEYIEDRFEPIKSDTYKEINFRDIKFFINFLYRSIVLQKRWLNLKTQRLGKSYIGGRKEQIINYLAKYSYENIYNLYDQIDKSEINYMEEAFNKNLRAYRIIGLIESPYSIKYSSTRLKNKIELQTTLYDDIKLISRTSKKQITNGLFFVTKYLKNLYQYFNTFNKNFLIKILINVNKYEWFKDIKEDLNKSIDEIYIEEYLQQEWAINVLKYLTEISDEFYKTQYSSYYRRTKITVEISDLIEY